MRSEWLVPTMVATATIIAVATPMVLLWPRQTDSLPEFRESEPVAIGEEEGPSATIFSGDIREAVRKYHVRGGRYRLGPNDCSTFVSDYLRAWGVDVGLRLTTKDLVLKGRMEDLGLTREASLGNEPGIFVFRYLDKAGDLRGHCGVSEVVDGNRWYIHNSGTAGGLVIQDREALGDSLVKIGVRWADVIVYRMPSLG